MKKAEESKVFDVIIVGGGVTGTALAYVLSAYVKSSADHSTGKKIALLEKNSGAAEVNSHPLNNAQTSHDGGTETNYGLAHALEVKVGAVALRCYVEARKDKGLFKKTHRMVLAVGAGEVKRVKNRFEKFSPYYEDIRLIGPEELATLERMVMKGRNPDEPVCAMVSSEGYAVDYKKLSESLLDDAKMVNKNLDVFFNVKVQSVRRECGVYVLETNDGVFVAEAIVFAAGSYSLLFAQELGYGLNLGLLLVAGDFFSAPELVNGKVYRVQVEGRPFAEIHADPDVLNQRVRRFGPTTTPLPLMERHHYETFFDFIRLPIVSLRGAWCLLKIIWKNKLFGYVFRNMVYSLPVIGKFFFLREARVIIPTIRYADLKIRKGVGGIRPQIVNLDTGELEMGDKTIVGENCIFNTTPSPGASVCIRNGKRDAEQIVKFFRGKYYFDYETFEKDLGTRKKEEK